MPKNSMLDTDFESEDTEFEHGGKQPSFGRDDDIALPTDTTEVEIEVKDDTPPEDKGRATADEFDTTKEDTEDEFAANYSKSVKNRIAKETAKVHAERRAKEERERQLNELVEASKRLIAENNQLKGLIENGEKVLVHESTNRLKGQIEAAKAAYREAVEAGDVNGQLAAQENMAKAIAEQDRLGTHRPQPLPRLDEKELSRYAVQQEQQVSQPRPDRKAEEWQERNPWFGRDPMMTNFALGMHQQLTQNEGIMPTDDQYYSRINSEMRKRFPERFQSAPRRTDTTVAPVVRNDAGRATRKVTLTESQVRLAKRLGLTPVQYAEQVAAENGQKEWTHG